METAKYRLGVGIMLINSDKKVWVGRRIDFNSDAWQMPQGGVDEGEDMLEAAKRELLEETGVSDASFIHALPEFIKYEIPDELRKQLWNGEYVGQKQMWYLAKFEGDDSEININTQTPEFNEWKWVEPQKLPDLIVEFKRDLYKTVLNEFLPHIKML